MINPPKINHTAADAKPAKIISGVDMENNIASRKNRSEVICSGITPVAQKLIVTRARAAAFVSVGERASGDMSRRRRAPATESEAKKSLRCIY